MASFVSAEDQKPTITVSAAAAATLIESRFPGQIISVNLQEDGLTYAIKVLNNGHMKTLYVDATNGSVSKLSD